MCMCGIYRSRLHRSTDQGEPAWLAEQRCAMAELNNEASSYAMFEEWQCIKGQCENNGCPVVYWLVSAFIILKMMAIGCLI
jgi:hypothetical protein